jgi:L-alanine-DL-glutamate epimerase-like enolase superfamily enzyme
MKITDVTAIPVNVPFLSIDEGGNAPYRTNHNTVEDVDRVLVRVDTDAGITGWGEVRVFLTPTATVSILEDAIGELVVGRSPHEVETFRRMLFTEYTTQTAMFFAPVEIACWDIVGKSLGTPVYELLGGWTAPSSETRRREPTRSDDLRVEFSYCMGILPTEDACDLARRVRREGYRSMQVKGGRDWRTDVERIAAIHDAVDGEVGIRLDSNQGYTIDEALRVGAELERRGVFLEFLEQPIRVDAHDALARLANRLRHPICANEDTYLPRNVPRLLDAGAADVFAVDMTPLGGITGLRQIAGIAEEANVPLTHHSALDLGVRTAAILHATCSIPGFSLPNDTAYFSWEADVIDDPFEIEDGSMAVPEGPGLGVQIDDDALDRYRIPTSELGRLYG